MLDSQPVLYYPMTMKSNDRNVSVFKFAFSALLVLAFAVACGGRGGTDGASVAFANLNDGDTVTSPFTVEMTVVGMTVQPAGEVVEGTGHHHIIINGGAIPSGQVIPTDDTHVHFGKGQTETELELEPGEYKLTLQFANGAHQSYGEALSSTINITVE